MADLNDIASIARAGGHSDFAALAAACRPMIAAQVARVRFRNAMLDAADLEQIALIAIREALDAWRPELAGFSTFAGRVIRCRILSALDRQTRRPGAVSLQVRVPREERDEDGIPLTLADTLADDGPSPYDLAARRDEAAYILRHLEADDATLILAIANGASYAEAGATIGIDAKSADNAIQRIRRKALQLRKAA